MTIVNNTLLHTEFGEFKINYHKIDNLYCLSLSMGNMNKPNTIIRLHSSCLFSESLSSIDCDCNLQLQHAMKIIAEHKRGVIIYLFQEGRGHGLSNKIAAMEIERTKGVDTVEAFNELHFDLDPRNYDIAIKALKELRVNRKIRLITNNPRKKKQLENGGFIITRRVILTYPTNDLVKKYLNVKKNKLGHIIPLELIT